MQLSRFASKQNLRPCWSICQLVVAASAVSWFTGSASAQIVPSGETEKSVVGQDHTKTQPFTSPFLGQVPIASPLSTTLVQNRPRFTLVPSVRTVYNSNLVIYPSTAPDDGDRDNLRVTPGIDLDYNRLFGRVLLSVSGSAGYDYNSRFKILNQSRINFNGSARAPVGSTCSAVATASYNRATFDFNDFQTGNIDAGQTSTIFNYGITAGCERSAGFSPVGSFNSQRLSRSQSRFFDSRLSTGSLGVLYSQPSIGILSLNATYTQIRRPFIAELTGVNDDTNIYDFAVGINRSVSPRFRINVSGGLTKAKPQRAAVQSFTGASYSGRLEWTPSSRFAVTGTMARQVTNQNGISATYVVREDYTISAELKASAKSQIALIGSRVQRDFRGESLTPSLVPLRADKLSNLSANYNYDISRRLRLSLGISHRWRTADNPIYDYESDILSTSIGAHF